MAGDSVPALPRVDDDLVRSRATVFFRLLLAIPHFVWLALWSVVVSLVAFIAWLMALVGGRLPASVHDFFCRYIRYVAHVNAYVSLVAEPFPGFVGAPGYPVDVELPADPLPQNRWSIGFRLLLAVPSILLSSALIGLSFGGSSSRSSGYSVNGGVLLTVGFLSWFSALARGRLPRGMRDAGVYAVEYQAQLDSYLLLLTDRYPDSDPALVGAQAPDEPAAARLRVGDDLVRSRVTVFFRALLALPHFVWLLLWTIAALLAAIAGWFAALATARLPDGLHRFLAAYVRYLTHVYAYVYLVADPFPGFTGAAGSYPVELEIDEPRTQSRWTIGFRWLLDVPAWMLGSAIGAVLFTAAVLGWFYALVTGRMPRGLRNAGAYAIWYHGQTGAYSLLLTPRYPYSGPVFDPGAVDVSSGAGV